MSFILDALRKSEHERQRQTGPALVEVAATPPRPRSNSWATAVVGLLVVNLVAIGVLLLVRSNKDAAAVAASGGPAQVANQSGSPTAAPSTQSGAPAAGSRAVASTEPQGPMVEAGVTPDGAGPATVPGMASVPAQDSVAGDAQSVPQAVPPPMLRPAEVSPGGARNPLEEEVSDLTLPDEYMAGAASTPAGPPAVVAAGSAAYREPAGYAAPVAPSQKRGSVVYQSIPEADPVTSPARAAAAAAATSSMSGLPTADEVTAANGMPELKLELHVYANRPADRFVFINSHKYREGEAMQEGATVESITPDGVVLSMRGNRFLLPRD